MICPSCGAENETGADVCIACGVQLALGPGDVIAGRYEVDMVIGEGGMGLVYKARDRVLDEVVALKVLRPGFAVNAEADRRFRSEIKLARKVSHRNVCRIHEYGEDGGLRYLSMEFVDGSDLKQSVRGKGGLSLRESCELAIQIAKGLQAIHDVGVIHRDLKTANIMIDGKGVVRLMDFGIAKQREQQGDGMTAAGEIVGTPEYMSPEQARNQKLDFRSDMYSLGIVLFEILTGKLPFKGETPLDTLVMHVKEPPPLEGNVPEPMLPVLRRALAKKAADRYASARGLVADLRAIIEREEHGQVELDVVEIDTEPALPAAVSTPGPRAEATVTVRVRELAAQLHAADPKVRWRAALGLWQMGPVAAGALDDLVEAVDDEAPAVADVAAEAYRRISGQVPPPRTRSTGMPAIQTQTRSQVDILLDAAALDALETEPPPVPPEPPAPKPPALAGLIESLQSSDSLARWRATLGLAALGPAAEEATLALVDALEDTDHMVRSSAVAALGKIGSGARDAVPALTAALSDPENPSMQQPAAVALGMFGPAATDAVPGLIAALRSPDPALRDDVLQAIVQIGTNAVPALLEALQDEDNNVRFLAADALTRISTSLPSS
jgi:HEAT repeat protein